MACTLLSRDDKGELLLRVQMNRPLAMKKDVIQTRNRKITRNQPKTFTSSTTKMVDEARDNRICYPAQPPLACGGADSADAGGTAGGTDLGDSFHQLTSFTNNSSKRQPNHGQDFTCDIKTQSAHNGLPSITADGYNMPSSSSFHQYMLDSSTTTATTTTTFRE